MITPEIVDEVAAKVEQQGGASEEVIQTLRASYEGIHFTYCMDDDIINPRPILEKTDFNIYLVDGREHCLCMTNDYDIATGIVVAEVIPDDD